MWMRSWQRIWRLMPSRAASVQTRIRKRIFCRIRVEAALQLFAAIQRRRAGKGRNSVVGLQIVKRFRQPLFYPAPRVLVFGEENQPPLIPAAVRRHVCPDPLGQPLDARIGPVTHAFWRSPASRPRVRGRKRPPQ